jgi:Flp pilus assembly protein TadG
MRRKSRASVMVEFALILPLFVFLALFAVEAGRLMLVRAELQDATQQAARAGAQVGGGAVRVSGEVWSVRAFNSALENSSMNLDPATSTFVVVAGSRCSTSDRFVTVRATTTPPPSILPGLYTLIGAANPNWSLNATSTALCEVSPP